MCWADCITNTGWKKSRHEPVRIFCGPQGVRPLVLDTSVRSQTYVEDCEVCCHPIELHYSVEDGAVTGFEAKVLE